MLRGRRTDIKYPGYSDYSLGCVKELTISTADSLYQVGAVIWHHKSRRFLLFIMRTGPYNLPAQFAECDLESALTDPLGFVARETGHTIEPVPLRDYQRYYAAPYSDRFDTTLLRAVATDSRSCDAFKVTLDMLWEEPNVHPDRPEGRQVVTFWFAGVIADEKPPQVAPRKTDKSTIRVGHLLSKNYTLNYLADRGHEGLLEHTAVKLFIELWNLTYPEDKI